ncbi:TauD/TfdA family dioxygenase [Phenylobacterium sp.]|uniref:TauD/TfdA family dioxygenase n=1 Tax=Phenylobacterium sp. TaxID=1871053 RepID=UPI00301DB018
MTHGAGPLSIAEQSAHFLTREHGGPPDGAVPGEAAWYGRDVVADGSWAEALTPDVIAAFEQALAAAASAGDPDHLTAADFPLEAIAPTLDRWRRTLLTGRGFLVLRGLPVERWSPAMQQLFMRGLGLQFGRLGLQNPQGDIIGEVRDTGAAKRDPYARIYATAGEFRFHCDASDVVGLLCIRPAARGGESRIASSVTVYNELLKRRPDLAARLFEPLALDLRNEQQAGAAAYAPLVPCAYDGALLRTAYLSDYFRTAARHVALPPADVELLDLYDEIAAGPGIGLAFHMRPGDVQVLYNHTTLHARTAFEDEPGRERLLLRFLASVGV